MTTTTMTPPMELVSLSSTPPVSSMGVGERTPLITPVTLTEEEPQIICSICNTVDCMIHNPRHCYCMNCGQKLSGTHACPNETENADLGLVQSTAESIS